MPLIPGQSLLHYRLVEKIGEGGMGEVWKAVDAGLGREVAIKVLPEAFAADAERLARFEREAKLLASLKHPNIAVVHGLHEDGGRRFLAMELAPGESLARVLGRERLPIEQVVALGRRVAEALEAAHEHGVIHRDLKPANIQVDAEGEVKVLDFGLAKAVESGPISRDLSLSPTMTSAPTAAGMILGTAAYMSPEQARGLSTDKRSDVWALGCVLYEALCARRAFEGETVSDTLAGVLRGEPDWSALPAETPSALRTLLRRCLIKDKQRRLRDIGEARIVLDDLERGAAQPVPSAGAEPRPVRRLGTIGGIVLIAAASFAAGYGLRGLWAPERREPQPDMRVRRVTVAPGLEYEPAISPEGNFIAYTSDDRGQLDLVVLQLGGGNENRVADSPADDAQPAWSPDGSRLAFVSARDRGGRLAAVSNLGILSQLIHGAGGDIFLVPAMGGSIVKIVEDGCYPAWSPDGRTLAFQALRQNRWDVWTVPVSGGAPQRITDDSDSDYQPTWSPDGRWIAFATLVTNSGSALRIVPAGGGDPFPLTDPQSGFVLGPAWSADGKSVFYSSDRAAPTGQMNLWRVRFDGGAPARLPPPERVTLGEGSDIGAVTSRAGRRLAYSSVQFKPDIWELEVSTRALRAVVATPSIEDFAHASPDGRQLVFESDRGGDQNALWLYDTLDRSWSRLVSEGDPSNPRWAPDGRSIAFARHNEAIAVQQLGAVAARTVAGVEPPETIAQPEWSPDGSRLAFTIVRDNAGQIFTCEASGGARRQLTDLPGNNSFPSWSSDGSTIAFQHEHEAPRQIWLVPAQGGQARALTDDRRELSHPQWHPQDPDRILVVIDHENLALVHVADGSVEPLSEFHESTVLVDYPSWSADGTKVYFSLARKTGDIYLLEGY